jgi:two-component system, OmpR family, KDP operon response regulator KdpE
VDETPRALRLEIGELVLDLENRRAWLNASEINFTRREFAVLTYLAQHIGRLVSDMELINAVWGNQGMIGDAALRSVIKRLRRKLGDDPRQPRYITTVWGQGYRFGAFM